MSLCVPIGVRVQVHKEGLCFVVLSFYFDITMACGNIGKGMGEIVHIKNINQIIEM